jgi:hypothetical protein
MTNLDNKVEMEYGEGWDLKRTVATIVLTAGILGGAVYGALQSATPEVKKEYRAEQLEKPTSQYEKKNSYLAVEK